MGYITQYLPSACTAKDSFASSVLSSEHTLNSPILPYNSIPDSLGDSLAPLSDPKYFGEEHNRSARLLPYSTRRSKTLILFTSHVLGAGGHTISARTLQLIDNLQPIPGPFFNVEPSMLRESECSQLLLENTQQGGLQFSKNLLNNSMKNSASYRSMICLVGFLYPSTSHST